MSEVSGRRWQSLGSDSCQRPPGVALLAGYSTPHALVRKTLGPPLSWLPRALKELLFMSLGRAVCVCSFYTDSGSGVHVPVPRVVALLRLLAQAWY